MRPVLILLCGGLISLLSPDGRLLAGEELAAAQSAYKKGDFAGAYALLPPLAQQGDPEALSLLGAMHANGFGVAQDDVKALMLFNLAGQNLRSDFRELRYNLFIRMTKEEISRAQTHARECLATDFKRCTF